MPSLSVLLIFLGFAGFLIALYIHHKKSRREGMVCPLRSDCTTVIHSDYSTFFGVPVERIGMLYYAIIALGYGARLAFPEALFISYLLFPATALAFFFSLYLTFIQFVILRRLCTWCLISACLCTIIFGLSLSGSLHFVLPVLEMYQTSIILVHLLATALGFGSAALADVFFFRFLKDFRISEQEAGVLATISEIIWFALGIILATGLALALPQLSELLVVPKFLMKMLVVAVIIVNGALLNLLVAPRLVKISFGEKHEHLSGELHTFRRLAFIFGPVSMASWLWAFLLGALQQTPFLFPQLLGAYLATLAVAIGIGMWFDKRLGGARGPRL